MRPRRPADIIPVLLEAARDGHDGVLHAAVGALLDSGRADLVETAVREAHRSSWAAGEAVEQAIETEAQRVVRGPAAAGLFCLPILLMGDAPFPADEFAALLTSWLSPGERVVLLDGWAGLTPLIALDPFGYRRLTNAMVKTAEAGGATHPVANLLAAANDRIEMVGENGVEPVAVRCVVGLLWSDKGLRDGGKLCDIVVDAISEELIADISPAVEAATGAAARVVMTPGRPFFAASDAAAATMSMGLDARYIAVQEMHGGGKPVTHLCSEGETLHLVLVVGDEVVDAVRLCLVGANPDELASLVSEQSSGVVEHANPDTLPVRNRHALH